MADPVGYGNSSRDSDQVLIALKKGTKLIKYGRRGKPRLCPFRLSVDETTLIWYSHGEERNLKLASVSCIIPGQRTAVFRRYFRPDKDYLSFSLLYNNGDRTLDLICKDKDETEAWFGGLKSLISKAQCSRHSRSKSTDLHDNTGCVQNGHSVSARPQIESSVSRSFSSLSSLSLTYTGLWPNNASLQVRRSTSPTEDASKISASSTSGLSNGCLGTTTTGDRPRNSDSSTSGLSSGGLGPDDTESLGDVFIWGEVCSDGNLPNGYVHHFPSKTNVLTPRPLDSNMVLDVHQVSCGARHAALVTRHGEIFTWGEESGGRLGHGTDRYLIRPQLVESLLNSVDYVACGEHHTCAVTTTGDLFTWGDGTHYPGLLGHGTDVSHWVPKRISGPLDGLHVLSVACGTWHSALVTSNGKLFTFGDGTFGALGHGDRESIAYPREIESLSESKILKVACGLWHTAAIVETMEQPDTNISSTHLFTWGDGDEFRLGHGNKESKLKPTCVSSLIGYNFHQLACGPSITVVIAKSGHVFTMGSTAYGQLGNPQSDGKLPCLAQNRLVDEIVEEISCGSFHVAVRTSKGKVFTWGRGANGRLGHGDTKDCEVPTLVKALSDRTVKSISCGSNFTSAICIYKWVSGTDHSVCSSCCQAFSFTRKRHNCYNCGVGLCHACSSKKALRAALSPTPGKPHRVCDSCYSKLKASEAGSASTLNKKNVAARHSKSAFKNLLLPDKEPIKYFNVKPAKVGMKSDSASVSRASPFQILSQRKDPAPSRQSSVQCAVKPVISSAHQPLSSHQSPRPPSPPKLSVTSRSVSPNSERPKSPHSTTPLMPLSFDTFLRKFEHLSQEVQMLQSQAKRLKDKCENQDMELQKSRKQAEEATSSGVRESSRCEVANEIKSVAVQLKEMIKKLPAEAYGIETFKAMCNKLEALHRTYETQESYVSSTLSAGHSCLAKGSENYSSLSADLSGNVQPYVPYKPIMLNGSFTYAQRQRIDGKLLENVEETLGKNDRIFLSDIGRSISAPSLENGSSSPKISTMKNVAETEATELFEPGVYVTLTQLQNGAKVFKGVRFSKRRFAEQHAENWWKENKHRVLRKYSMRKDSVPQESRRGVMHVEEDEPMSASPKLVC